MTQGGSLERLAGREIDATKTAADAAAAGVYYFERPADKPGAAARRADFANSWLERFNREDSAAAAPPPTADDHPLTIHKGPASGGSDSYAAKGAPVLADYMDSPGHITPDGERRYNAARAAWQQGPGNAAPAPDVGSKLPPPISRPMQPFGRINFDPLKASHPQGVAPLTMSPPKPQSMRGDTSHTFTQNVTVQGVQKPDEVANAVKATARRGGQDYLRFTQGSIA